ncbi:hypothetical protein B566_EDAN009767 [Ephemera danica]|nr:hypothetical protein B566_EDAN009767 [Ephemera danica]
MVPASCIGAAAKRSLDPARDGVACDSGRPPLPTDADAVSTTFGHLHYALSRRRQCRPSRTITQTTLFKYYC